MAATSSPITSSPITSRYSTIAVLLHWIIAALIIGQIAGGKVMTELAATTLKFDLYQWHKALGLIILALSLARLLWRLTHRPPALAIPQKAWERRLARFSHWGFYAFMIAVPLLGWLTVSAAMVGLPTSMFGLFTVPDLPVADSLATERLMKRLHALTAYATAALLVLHVAAAIKHQRDGHPILHRMSLKTRT